MAALPLVVLLLAVGLVARHAATARSAPAGLQVVGPAATFASGSSAAPHTALPAGASVGDLLISVVSTYDFATVRFDPGWTTAYDVDAGGGAHLVAAWRLVAGQVSPASAQVDPPTQVSMATVAIRNVDPANPVETVRAGPGTVSPGVTTRTPGTVLVLPLASTSWQLTPGPPAGATLAASTNDQANSAVAVAVTAPAAAGVTPGRAWSGIPSGASVAAGTIAVRPAGGAGPLTQAAGPSSAGPSPAGPSPGGAAAPALAAPAGTAPAAPTPVCGRASLAGPATPPAGAVTVRPGQDLGDVVAAHGPNTTYWLAPGTHRLGTGPYDQVIPQSGDTFLGAPGATLDGQHLNLYAFTGSATGVTISHLTVQDFGAPGDNNNEGVVNHDSGTGWTVESDVIQDNAGAGVMIGSGDRILGNCLRDNGQYGFNAYSPDGVSGVVVDGNEISGNNTDDWEKRQPGCGCTGGGKFWATRGATVTANYVHDNRGVGLWADSNNAGFLFRGNYISGNDDEGLMYEASYNAAVLDNTFVRNALVEGPTNPDFPASAIYLSESGSDPRVAGPYGDRFRISGNVFVDNWSGVVAWENADRFAGSPANTSTGLSTLVAPATATVQACGTASVVSRQPYLEDCRWRTQNVLVDHNTFTLDPAHVAGCTEQVGCGFNGLFSNYGTYPDWSPYKGVVIEDDITFKQDNRWQDNTYRGPWSFMVHAAGNVVSWQAWRAAPYDQDAGSTAG